MALSVDPLTNIITIPKTDLTLVGGTIYSLDTNAFRLELKAWEYSAEGIVQLVTHIHNTEVSVAGTTFARTVEVIPPYSITFEDGQYTVILEGSNNNIFDVASGILNQNQVQIISQNSAGLITVTSGSVVTEQDKLDIADRVWDESLTAVSHNVPTSAGRRLRSVSTAVIITGTAVSSTVNTIVLDNDASAVDGAYDPALITIVNGTGAGQTRLVFEYEGSTKTAIVDRNWKVNPDATSEYTIIAHPGREHVNEGRAQGGGSNTITLNSLGSPDDNAYNFQIIFIRSGTGEDQVGLITAYDGTTKIATVDKDWDVVPDATSGYCILPDHIHYDDIAKTVWDRILTGATHNVPSSAGRRLRTLGDIVSASVDDAGATTSSFITDLSESRDNFYDDQLIRFTSGNLIGYVRPILSYDGTSKTITVSETMVEAPDNGSEFDIIPTHVHPISQIADSVWDETAADHTAAGSTGEQAEDTLKKAKLAAYKL